MIEFFSLLSEASEPITKLLGKFFVVEIWNEDAPNPVPTAARRLHGFNSVSYTHLTLPTKA